MEFRIQGFLDENGQIKSVQSCCSHSDIAGLPFGGPILVRGPGVRESKVVDYAVKKELDGKVEEMSQLLVHLKHTQDSYETAKKLIKEYEGKIKGFKRCIYGLQKENAHCLKVLKENGIDAPFKNIAMDEPMSATFPKFVDESCRSEANTVISESFPNRLRSSVTEVTIGFRHSVKLTDSLYAVPDKTHDETDSSNKVTKDSDKPTTSHHNETETRPPKISVNSCSNATRPSKLNIPNSFKQKDIQARENKAPNQRNSFLHPGNDGDNVSDGHKTTSDSKATYTQNDVDSKSPCTQKDVDSKSTCTQKDDDSKCVPGSSGTGKPRVESNNESVNDKTTPESDDGHLQTTDHALLCDNYGYVILLVPSVPTKDDTILRKKTEMRAANGEMCSKCQCDRNVHVSWSDFNRFRHSCGSTTQQDDSGDESVQQDGAVADGGTQQFPPDIDTIDGPNGMTFERMDSRYAKITDTDDVFYHSDAGTPGHGRRSDDKYADRAPPPLPGPTCNHRDSNGGLSSKDSPVLTPGDSFSPGSCKRGQCKADEVKKMMRMTSEWNTSKRNLLEKSVKRTSHDAENILGSVVEKTIECFQEEFINRRKRASTNMIEKVIQKVKDSLKIKYDEDVLTTEFLDKCVHLCDREFLHAVYSA